MRRLVQAWVICACAAAVARAQTTAAAPEYVDVLTNIETTTRVIEDAEVKIAPSVRDPADGPPCHA